MRLVSALAWTATLLAFVSGPARAQSNAEAMAIPAYFSLQIKTQTNPSGGHDDWINLLTAQAVAKIVVLDMSTLALGGSGLSDCTRTPSTMIDCLHANGSLVLGYVNAGFGCRSVSEVLGASGNTNNAGVGDWFPAYNVDGIFFDNAVVDPSNPSCFLRSNFESIFTNVHSNHAWNHAGPDMCGGRACILINASQYADRWVLDSPNGHADFAVTYENPTSGSQETQGCGLCPPPPAIQPPGCLANSNKQSYFGVTTAEPFGFCPKTGLATDQNNCVGNAMNPVNWYFTHEAWRTAHVLRQNSGTGTTDLNTVIAQSQTYKAGFLYISDTLCNGSTGAQYGHLTSYYPTLKSSLGARLTIDRTNGNTNTGAGTVTSAGNGINCDGSTTNKCDNLIAKNTVVKLLAQADSNSTFVSLEVNGSSCPIPCSFPLTGPTSVVATFNKTSNRLAVSKDGVGTGIVKSSTGEISCGATCAATYNNGTTVTLTATPNADSTFGTFSGCDSVSGNSCSVTMTSSRNVTATFNPLNFNLTLSKTGTGTGVVTSSPIGINCGNSCTSELAPFASGLSVTLTAAAAAGSRLVGFSGCDSTSGVTCTVAMSAARNVTATFNGQYNLALIKSGAGTGNVTSTPVGISCGTSCASQTQPFDSGLSVNLTATADAGSRFVSFSGCTSTTGTSCSVNMSAAANVTVTFYQQFNLTLTKSGSGTGNVQSASAGILCGTACTSQQAPFDSGVTVALTATSDANSSFGGFSGCDSVSGSTCSVTMNAARNVTATFTVVNYNLTLTKAGTGTGLVSSNVTGINCGTACASQVAPFAVSAMVTLTAAADMGRGSSASAVVTPPAVLLAPWRCRQRAA